MTLKKPLILASASPRRQEILTLAGVPFVVSPADSEWAPNDLPLHERVRALARSKAQAVASRYPDNLLLGADTMVAVDERVLGKPRSEQEAVEMLLSLQGREHQVLTGVWVIRTDSDGNVVKEDGFTDVATVRFFPMTQQDALEYVASGEPLDKAGAYGIQGRGMRYVAGIAGDYYTVMGLPGGRLVRYLQEFAPDLWK